MVGVLPRVRAALLGVLVSGCGKTADEPPRSARGDSRDRPGPVASSSVDAATGIGNAHPERDDQDLARDDVGEATETPCDGVDGRPSYGPIGERRALALPSAIETFGFRTGAGYAFVWRTHYDPRGPSPNLFIANLDADFQGGEARPLAVDTAASALDIVPAPRGFLAAICREESHLEWIGLNDDFAESNSALPAPEAPCESALPGVLWTGEVTLVSFTDARGFVIVCLDEQGAVVGEEVLLRGVGEPIPSRFSQNGDRVLLVFEGNGDGTLYTVFDSRGTRLTDLQAFGTEYSGVQDIAIAPAANGWLVATDNWGGDHGVVLRVITEDGLLAREDRLFGRYVVGLDLAPSVHGGALLIAEWDTGGQFGGLVGQIALIDDAGEVVYSEERSDLFPAGLVVDPERDLVIEGARDQSTVQEYGCLD